MPLFFAAGGAEAGGDVGGSGLALGGREGCGWRRMAAERRWKGEANQAQI